MTEIFIGITPQPDFPKEDLTDINAAVLELLLSNQGFMDKSHVASEEVSWVFKVGHRVVSRVSGDILNHDSRFDALNHGVSIYEVMSLLLTAVPIRTSETFSVETQATAWVKASPEKLIDYQEEAYAAFSQNLPRAKEVVGSATDRFYPHLTSYAILGAAMAHQFELDAAA